MTRIYYQISGGIKHSEMDDFKEGCLPETAVSQSVDHLMQASTIDDLITMAMRYCGCDAKENVILNSCDELGRIDIQVMEDRDGIAASPHEIDRWKENDFTLFHTTYSFPVSRIREETDFDLTAIVTNPKDYSTD